jgi:hypothetical protein
MTEPHLKLENVKVKQLVADYRSGLIVIPEFQRDYVWRKSKAPKLIDSLYRGFPISSLLLWQSAEQERSRRREPRPIRSANMSWLLDGQQRVITLARTMSGDEGIDVVYNPDDDQFRLAEAGPCAHRLMAGPRAVCAGGPPEEPASAILKIGGMRNEVEGKRLKVRLSPRSVASSLVRW